MMLADGNHVRDIVARFVFVHLHGRLFPQEPTDVDLRTAAHISRLAWLRPRHLDLAEAFVDIPEFRRAARSLRRLHLLRSPVEMLASLARTFQGITEAACVRAAFHTSHGKGVIDSASFGADASLPMFILLVLRANPPMLSSVLAYVECFTTRAQMLTEQGYAVTQARAAASFVESVRPCHLVGLAQGEWHYHMGS